MLQWINRFRQDPAGEYDRLFSPSNPAYSDIMSDVNANHVNLNKLHSELAALTPAPPLAWNYCIHNSAYRHDQMMIAYDQQAHQIDGEADIGQRMTNAGYPGFMTAGAENIFGSAKSAIYAHAAYVIDWGSGPGGMQTGRGHRSHLISSSFREIGVDLTNLSTPKTDVWGPLVNTEDMANRTSLTTPILLGVAYRDGNRNGFYDDGEGIDGLSVTAHWGAGAIGTWTGPAGEYSFPLLPGTYSVTFGDFDSNGWQQTINGVTIGQNNVEQDCRLLEPLGPDSIITGAGAGGGPHVEAFRGSNLGVIRSFFPYDTHFTGGVRVAAGDINGDGWDDIITGAGSGRRPARAGLQRRRWFGPASFFPYDTRFTGGVPWRPATSTATAWPTSSPAPAPAAARTCGSSAAPMFRSWPASSPTTPASPAGFTWRPVTSTATGGPTSSPAPAPAGPHVRVFDGAMIGGRGGGSTGSGVLRSFFPYDTRFTGGVYVAAGDINGDGRDDIITGAGAGGGPHVQVFSGADGSVLRSFFAYDTRFTGGVRVAAGDINGDGLADIITGAGAGGGPHVRVFSGADVSVLASFFAYDTRFTGGVYVAAGDINGDGRADIITGAGTGAGPHVRVFNGAMIGGRGGGSTGSGVLRSFFPYDTRFTGGVYVAAGDINGDGRDDIITGAGAGGGPHVQVFSGADGSVLRSFFPYDTRFTGGVRVAAGDINRDGRADIITGAGAGGGPHVQVFSGTNNQVIRSFFPYDTHFTGGVYVAGLTHASIHGNGSASNVPNLGLSQSTASATPQALTSRSLDPAGSSFSITALESDFWSQPLGGVSREGKRSARRSV